MNNDSISRQAAIDAFMEILDRPNHAEFLYTDEICGVLCNLPPVQPRKGLWIYFSGTGYGNPYGHFECDLCGGGYGYKTDFCPSCGADMREGDAE